MQKALILAYQTEDIVILPMTNNEIAKLYIQIGDYSKALNALYEALRLSKMEHDGDIREQSVTHQLLADSYVRQHRFDSAYVHLKAYYELREDLLDKEKSERINELEIAYQSQQKELENTQLRDHNRTIYNQYLLLFTTSVVLLAGILAALMYSYRLRQQKKVIARQKQAVEQLAAELTQSQEHLTTILQEKSHLTSLITHDIQTPLSVIKFTASSILAENPTEALQADVKTINRAAEQIRYLSQRISDVQKIEAPDILPKLAPVNLVAIARETAPFYIQWGEKKHVQLIEQIEVPEVMVLTDAFLLSKAIGNLLGNAVKFSTQGQCVYIRITKLHECGQIEIQDEGPGMSEEDQQKAFHKFQKLSAQPTSGEPSTGNGLYLAKRYVEAMNGIILLQSTLGKGSTFTIRLPLVKD
ncbi:MAG: ATP-binding protein [Saprospiraceae bacterium]